MTPLAKLLARIGWTTGELSARLDVSPDTTSRWARGTRTPPPSVLVWLAAIADAVATVDSQPAGWDGVRAGRRAAEMIGRALSQGSVHHSGLCLTEEYDDGAEPC